MADNKPAQNEDEVVVPPPKRGRKTTNQASNDEQVAVPPPKSGDSGNGNNALKIILIIVGAIVVLGLLALLTFGWLFKGAVDKVTDGVDVSRDGETVKISDSDGENSFEVSGDDKELPDDFPDQVNLIEPYVLNGSSKFKTGEQATWTVTTSVDGSTNENFNKVQQRYDQSDEWEETGQTQVDDSYRIIYTNEMESLTVSIALNPNDDEPNQSEVVYSVVYSPDQE